MTAFRHLASLGATAGLVIAATLLARAQRPAPTAEQPTPLQPGRTVEREIGSHDVHPFRVALDSGSLLRVAVT